MQDCCHFYHGLHGRIRDLHFTGRSPEQTITASQGLVAAVYKKFQHGRKINGEYIFLELIHQYWIKRIQRLCSLNNINVLGLGGMRICFGALLKEKNVQYRGKRALWLNLFGIRCTLKSLYLHRESGTYSFSSFQMLSTLVTAAAPTYLYFALEESKSRNLWLVSPACFLIGSIYTFTIIIPEVKVILDEKVIEKKGWSLILSYLWHSVLFCIVTCMYGTWFQCNTTWRYIQCAKLVGKAGFWCRSTNLVNTCTLLGRI